MKKLLLLSSLYLLLSTPVSAQSVDILWHGNTYTPPLYEGKAMWSKQSYATLVAIPQGLSNPASLNYRWIRNGTVLGNISGVGKNSLRLKDTIFSKPQEVAVEIVSQNDDIVARTNIFIEPINVELLIYEKNPLYGYIFNREIGSKFKLAKSEVTLSAFPLYNDTYARDSSNFLYKWSTGGKGARPGHTITYRVPENASGYVNVKLSFSNTDKILRGISQDLTIQLDQNE